MAAALAGAAFPVEAALAFLPPLALFLPLSALEGASTLCAGGLASASLDGAGLSVGFPAMSPAPSAGVIAPFSFAGAALAFADFSALLGFSAFSAFGALWSPIATIFRIVCCWRWPYLRR